MDQRHPLTAQAPERGVSSSPENSSTNVLTQASLIAASNVDISASRQTPDRKPVRRRPSNSSGISNAIAYHGLTINRAAMQGNLPVCVLLWGMATAKRLNIMVADNHGNTPMHYAALADNSEVMGFFNQQTRGMLTPEIRLVDSRNELGETPLLKAATKGVIVVMKALIDEGSDLFARDSAGSTIFIILVRNGHLWCLNYIHSYMKSKYGSKRVADHLVAVDNDCHNVLDWAAHGGDCNILEFLLRNDVDLFSCDPHRRSALFWATKARKMFAVRFLVLGGLKPFDVDDEGISPYLIAKSYRDKEMMSLMKHCWALYERQVSLLKKQSGVTSSNTYSNLHTSAGASHFDFGWGSGSNITAATGMIVGGSDIESGLGTSTVSPTESARLELRRPTSAGLETNQVELEPVQPFRNVRSDSAPAATLTRSDTPPESAKAVKSSSDSSSVSSSTAVTSCTSNTSGSGGGGSAAVVPLTATGVYSGMSPEQLEQIQQHQQRALAAVNNRAQLTDTFSPQEEAVGIATVTQPTLTRTSSDQDPAVAKMPPLLYSWSYDYGRLNNFFCGHLLYCHGYCRDWYSCDESRQLLTLEDEQSENNSVTTSTGLMKKRSHAIHWLITSRSRYLFWFCAFSFFFIAMTIWVDWYIWMILFVVIVVGYHKLSSIFPPPDAAERKSKGHGRRGPQTPVGSSSGNNRRDGGNPLQLSYASYVAGFNDAIGMNDKSSTTTLLVLSVVEFCKAAVTAPERYMGFWMGCMATYAFYLGLSIAEYFYADSVGRHFNGLQAIGSASNFPLHFCILLFFSAATIYYWLWIEVFSPDPGIVDTRYEDFDEIMQHSSRIRSAPPSQMYCRTSLVRKPLRSKYCAQSGFVIARMDHFCVWLNSSIGFYNHIAFMKFLFSHTLASGLFVALLGRELHFQFSGYEDSSACQITERVFSKSYFFVVLLCAFQVIVCCGLLMLTAEQCWNIAHNITTNERLNGARYAWMKDDAGVYPCNRFNRGIIINILEFFQVYPDYNVDYRSIFEIPSTYVDQNGVIVTSPVQRPLEDMRFENASSHSSASGYSDPDSRSRSSSLTSV